MEEWRDSKDFKTGLHFVHHLNIVNDREEHGVSLNEERNSILHEKEHQKQDLKITGHSVS